jgi:DNA polymerase III subunit epsilon
MFGNVEIMFCVIDLETTGTRPQYDKITEIAILLHDGQRVVDRFQTLIYPERRIPPLIFSITGISDGMVESAPRFHEVAKKIVEMTSGKIFVAHNAHFDHAFLKKEFADLGYRFQAETLCTIRMSRKTFPGLPSYSLGKLCESLKIPFQNRHRAMGDAEATAKLLSLILKKNPSVGSIHSKTIEEELSRGNLPPELPIEEVEVLPKKAGVYFFKDSFGKVIYIGKSKNIRSRVLSHFTSESRSGKPIEFLSEIASIDYFETGNEWIALLREAEAIKRFRPKYNHALKKRLFRYGLFVKEDSKGYLRFQIKTLPHFDEPVWMFGSRRAAIRALEGWQEEYELCLKFVFERKYSKHCSAYPVSACRGACIGDEPAEDYNLRIGEILSRHSYPESDFAVLAEGRSEEELAYVLVSENKFQGYGFLPRKQVVRKRKSSALRALFQEHLQPLNEDRDMKRIVLRAIKSQSDIECLSL